MFRNPTFVALLATLYLLVFVVLLTMGYHAAASLLFMLSPLLVVWLVYVVLRYGEASGRTFDEYFYDDMDIRADKWRE